MKKQKFFFAALAFTFLAAIQTINAQTLTTSDKYSQNSTYVTGSPQGGSTMQTMSYVSTADNAVLDVQNDATTGRYDVYVMRNGTWYLVDSQELRNGSDATVYDATIQQPGSDQLRIVVSSTTPQNVSVMFKE